jgi:ABC-type multidrug transport system fused ATPase/permease subunit
MSASTRAMPDFRNAAFGHVESKSEQDVYNDAKNLVESKRFQVVKDEVTESGAVPYALYWYYLKNCSFALGALVLFLLLSNMALDSWNEFWLQRWGESNIGGGGDESRLQSNLFFLGIFAAGTIGTTLLSILMDLAAIRYMALRASRKMHEKALVSTLAAPISFFHANPAGRIINRFSNDIMALDRTIPGNLLGLLNSLFG